MRNRWGLAVLIWVVVGLGEIGKILLGQQQDATATAVLTSLTIMTVVGGVGLQGYVAARTADQEIERVKADAVEQISAVRYEALRRLLEAVTRFAPSEAGARAAFYVRTPHPPSNALVMKMTKAYSGSYTVLEQGLYYEKHHGAVGRGWRAGENSEDAYAKDLEGISEQDWRGDWGLTSNQFQAMEDLRSILAVPVVNNSNNQVIGVVVVDSSEPPSVSQLLTTEVQNNIISVVGLISSFLRNRRKS